MGTGRAFSARLGRWMGAVALCLLGQGFAWAPDLRQTGWGCDVARLRVGRTASSVRAGPGHARWSAVAGSGDEAGSGARLGCGSYVALVTPMHESGKVDMDALQELLELHARNSDGVVALGTTGEAAALTTEERDQVIRAAVATCAPAGVPVVIGTGSNNFDSTLEMTLRAMELGAAGVLVVTPYYVKPPQRCLSAHFTRLADAVTETAQAQGCDPIPIVLYNVPGRTGCDLKPETVAELAEHPGIAGLKEASGLEGRLSDLQGTLAGKGDFILYSGEDSQACEWSLEGGHGVISVTANVAPGTMRDMIQAARDGRAEAAKSLDAQLQPLHESLFCTSNPIPVKWALHRMGHMKSSTLRLPLMSLEEELQPQVENALKDSGMIG